VHELSAGGIRVPDRISLSEVNNNNERGKMMLSWPKRLRRLRPSGTQQLGLTDSEDVESCVVGARDHDEYNFTSAANDKRTIASPW